MTWVVVAALFIGTFFALLVSVDMSEDRRRQQDRSKGRAKALSWHEESRRRGQ